MKVSFDMLAAKDPSQGVRQPSQFKNRQFAIQNKSVLHQP